MTLDYQRGLDDARSESADAVAALAADRWALLAVVRALLDGKTPLALLLAALPAHLQKEVAE